MKRAILILTTISCAFLIFGQKNKVNPDHSAVIRLIYDVALEKGHAYEDLRSLCKDVGHRLAGSAQVEMAVFWGVEKLREHDFDTVYLQEVMVPHWERGKDETGWVKLPGNKIKKLNPLALGGSIGSEGLLEKEIILFQHRDDLQAAKKEDVEGKIVFINQPMDAKIINTFQAYGGCYPIRGYGAVDAAEKGAAAVVIRSLTLKHHDHAHTGTMHYKDSVKRIPGAAISSKEADWLAELLASSKEPIKMVLNMNCQRFPDKLSHNVIGEMRGSVYPQEIIAVGGHLDSWDVGEGAHDDGAGIVHSMEAVRILKAINYQPKYTLRVVFFMNEEFGNSGGIKYAEEARRLGEQHIAAIESDRGGFTPRGFTIDGSEKQLKLLQSFEKYLSDYDLHKFEAGFSGVDINPLKEVCDDIALFGFIPDSQRYFDYHHNANDVFENVNKRELELGAAAIAALIYLLDQNL